MSQGKCWTKEEDLLLKRLYEEEGVRKWSVLAGRINKAFENSNKIGKQCRQRYHNSLASNICKRTWTQEDEKELFQLHDQLGNKWTEIAFKLSGRSHNDVKNRFYADIKKSLRKFNRWQKHYKIKSTKPIKIEGLTKIFSLGFKNYPQEDQYKHLSEECLRVKHELLEFYNYNPHSENFKKKIVQFYKSVTTLTCQLRNYRVGKVKSLEKQYSEDDYLKLEQVSPYSSRKSLDEQQNEDQNEKKKVVQMKKQSKYQQKQPFDMFLGIKAEEPENNGNDVPLGPIKSSFMDQLPFGYSYHRYSAPPPAPLPYGSEFYYPFSMQNYYMPGISSYYCPTDGTRPNQQNNDRNKK